MSFDNIKLEKGLYTTGKSFTDALESIDPSENYVGTSLEGLDAYERQLKRFDIKVSGPNSDSISKFFSTTESAALFPEYVSRAVKTGMVVNSTVNDVVATVTNVDALDYRSFGIANDVDDFRLISVNEGAALSEINISVNDKLTKLRKYGKMISATYEAIKYQKLDLFTVVLKKIGNSIANNELLYAIDTILDSDFNQVNKTSETIQYKDLINLWSSCCPFDMNTIACSKNQFAQIMNLDEFKSSNGNINFNIDGKVTTLLGANVIMLPNEIPVILGLDKNYAVEKVQAGGVLTEFDKLIDRQLERATISTITGFNVIYEDAVSVIE